MTVAPATLLLVLLACCSSKKSDDRGPIDVPDPKKAAAAHDAKEWKKCAELWLAVAATTKGEAMINPLYDAACCQAQGGEIDAAFATLDRAVGLGMTTLEIQGDVDLTPLHADPRWPRLIAAIEQQRAKAEAAVKEPALRDELVAMERLYGAQNDAIEAAMTQRMKEIVAQHGWPGKSLVGKEGAHAAWVVVQHSRDGAFQKACLEKLELAVTLGEAQAVEHAYLYDRVAVNSGKPQRWGTQMKDDGTPHPIEDEPRVDARRKAIGLPTMAEQRKLLPETRDE
jgi:hypothetical protein